MALIALLVLLGIGYAVHTASGKHGSATRQVALSSLPTEAQRTVALIHAGGPFPYSQDGAVFHNAEGHLPHEPDGYYHEYTVLTPGASTRGARRIITGRDGQFYYTADHYDSFEQVDLSR